MAAAVLHRLDGLLDRLHRTPHLRRDLLVRARLPLGRGLQVLGHVLEPTEQRGLVVAHARQSLLRGAAHPLAQLVLPPRERERVVGRPAEGLHLLLHLLLRHLLLRLGQLLRGLLHLLGGFPGLLRRLLALAPVDLLPGLTHLLP